MFERWRRAVDGVDTPRLVTEAQESTPIEQRRLPSLAELVVVVATDPERGKPWDTVQWAVACAVLLQLVHEGKIEVSGEGKTARVSVTDPRPLGDPVLDTALERLDIGHDKLVQKITGLKNVDAVVDQLLARGLMARTSRKVLGMFPVDRLEPTAVANRDELVTRLRRAVLGEQGADEQTMLLLAAVFSGVHLKLVVERGEVGAAYRRAPELIEAMGGPQQAVLSAVKAARAKTQTGYTGGIG